MSRVSEVVQSPSTLLHTYHERIYVSTYEVHSPFPIDDQLDSIPDLDLIDAFLQLDEQDGSQPLPHNVPNLDRSALGRLVVILTRRGDRQPVQVSVIARLTSTFWEENAIEDLNFKELV